jgi:hypothetical protein
MSYETGAPPPPDHPDLKAAPVVVVDNHDAPPASSPAKQYDATSVIAGLAGPPPGTTTYRLRGTETTKTD